MHRSKLPVSLSIDGNRWENKLGYRCGTGRTPVPIPEKIRKRHCSASRTLVQVQTYRISTVPVEYRYR